MLHRQLPDTVSQADIESVVRATCDDESIDGILVQVRKLACGFLLDIYFQVAAQSAMALLLWTLTAASVYLQLPLPKHLDDQAVVQAVDPKKDVDGFHPHHR